MMFLKRRVSTFLFAFAAWLALAPALSAQPNFTFGTPMKENPGHRVLFNTAEKRSYWIDVMPSYLNVTVADNYLKADAAPRRVQLAFPRSLGQVKLYIDKFFAYSGKNYIIYSTVDEGKNLTIYSQELSPDFTLQGAPVRMAKFTDADRGDSMMFVGSGFMSMSPPFIGISKSGRVLALSRSGCVNMHWRSDPLPWIRVNSVHRPFPWKTIIIGKMI